MASALLGAELRSWLTAAEVQRQCRRQLCRRAANQTQTAVPVTTRFLCKYRYFCTYAYFVVKDCIFVLLRNLFTFICEQLAAYDHVQGGPRKRGTILFANFWSIFIIFSPTEVSHLDVVVGLCSNDPKDFYSLEDRSVLRAD